MKVPQFQPKIDDQEYRAIAGCFERNWITEGPACEQFKNRILELTGAKYGVLAPNGTLALYLGLRALDIKAGDEVIVPDFTFIASATSVEMTGARPVFVDVNRKNFQMDPALLEAAITSRTKAIMPVHMYGTAVAMEEIIAIAKRHDLKIIEDAAQALGVRYRGQHAGTFGAVGCFSFFADKTITTGEGGMVVTDDESLHQELLYLRNQGRINRGSFVHPKIGYNFRMTDIQGAIGLVQVDRLSQIVERKLRIKDYYTSRLAGLPGCSLFQPEASADWIPFRFLLLTDQAKSLMAALANQEIETRTFFYPLHRQPCFQYMVDRQDLGDECFPNSTFGFENGVCLPTFPDISDDQLEWVCSSIERHFEKQPVL